MLVCQAKRRSNQSIDKMKYTESKPSTILTLMAAWLTFGNSVTEVAFYKAAFGAGRELSLGSTKGK
jgi:hypothetical protein